MKLFKSSRLFKSVVAFAMAAVMALSIPSTAQAATAGIDVSKYQGAINWSAVAASGVTFTFIKAGSTNSGVDPYFTTNIAGAQAAGIRTGVYIYSYATSVAAAQAEAKLVLQWVANANVNYPIALDIEDSVQKGLDANTVTAMCNAFGDVIAAAGYTPIIYTYTNFYKSHITSALKYPKWIAQYGDSCDTPGYSIWQYSSSGSVAGISGRVDMNIDVVDWRNYIIAYGPCNIGGNIYIFNNYVKQFGWSYIAGTYYLTDATTGVAVTSTWYTEPTTNKRYYLNTVGAAVTGINTIGDGIYYFNDDATLYTGWKALGNYVFLFSATDGKLYKGWYKDSYGTYYLDANDGHRASGATVIDGATYYFNADGLMQTGLVEISGYKFYFGADGKMVTSTFESINGSVYYFGDNGAMATGLFVDSNGDIYDAASDGHIITNEAVKVGNSTYVFGSNGKLVKDQLYTIGKTVYACDENGVVTATATK